MGRKRKQEPRILGPYGPYNGKYRILVVDGSGEGEEAGRDRKPRTVYADNEEDAEDLAKRLRAGLTERHHTTESALAIYLEFLREEQRNQPESVYRTEWSVRQFFPNPVPLWGLTEEACRKAYKALSKPRPALPRRDGKPGKPRKPLSPDSHRNALAETKTFLNWCVQEKFLPANPLANIKGVGKRNKRKPQLVTKEARAWYHKALDLADRGDEGAVAALLALELGPRASEITDRLVRHVDEDEAPADRLWIPDSKTESGERVIEVPEELRPFLIALIKGRPPSGYLFPATRSKAAIARGEPERPHWRDWPRKNIHRICKLAGVPLVSAHGMRGLLATLAYREGIPANLIAATLGHRGDDGRMSKDAYAERHAPDQGARKRGRLKLVK